METTFIRNCNSIIIQLEALKREVEKMKINYSGSVKNLEPPLLGKSRRLNFDDLLPIETVMPSEELIIRCKEHSERKYKRRPRSQTH